MALPRLTVTFADKQTKTLFIRSIQSLENINIDPYSFKGSIENTEVLHIDWAEPETQSIEQTE
jgi:hypothetical protein